MIFELLNLVNFICIFMIVPQNVQENSKFQEFKRLLSNMTKSTLAKTPSYSEISNTLDQISINISELDKNDIKDLNLANSSQSFIPLYLSKYFKLNILQTFTSKSELNFSIKEETMTNIKLFHVFDDESGYNVLYITSEDQVFGFGSNEFGCCGLGHNSVVNEPQIIPELCHKNIQQFFLGVTFTLGLSGDHLIYGWGWNKLGQLGQRESYSGSKYLKPAIIISLKGITMISCGSFHSLALSEEGYVFGWGNNSYGQVGCGQEKGQLILEPYHLKQFERNYIKSIHSTYSKSLALTYDGLVYYWGINYWIHEAEDLEQEHIQFSPRLIDIKNVNSISPSSANIYFLNNQGLIYYSGLYLDDQNNQLVQKIPRILTNSLFFSSIHAVNYHQKRWFISTAISGNSVYFLNWNSITKYNYESIFDFYAHEYKVSYKTINIDKDIIPNVKQVKGITCDKAEPNNDPGLEEGNEQGLFESESEDNSMEKVPSNKFLKIEMFSKVEEELKDSIKAFHVFDDEKGYNVLFITSDDKVFGFGSNCFGCCGLGHNSVVNEPQIIPELCHKNIQQFSIGKTFILAINSDKQVYGWGSNSIGQLGESSQAVKFSKPILIIVENDRVVHVSCGSNHCLALTLNGGLYGWGDNSRGQVGCGQHKGNVISKPIQLKCFTENVIKNIICSYDRSFALTSDGLVYSWGSNTWCSLGHELPKNQVVYVPQLMKVSKVVTVCPSTTNTYFLSREGQVYFCGLYKDRENFETYQKTPKLLNYEQRSSSLHHVNLYQKHFTISTANYQESIKCLSWSSTTMEIGSLFSQPMTGE